MKLNATSILKFSDNPRTEVKELREAVIEQTRLKLAKCKMAIAIHDTTLVKPTAKSSSIDEFRYNKGFFAHASLLINPDDTKEIFGIGAVHLWSRLRKLPIRTTGEHARWLDQVKRTQENFDDIEFIHVMDREGDSCPLWSELVNNQYRFVIRLKHNRHVKTESGEASRLWEEMESAKIFGQKTIQLSRRKGSPYPNTKTAHPPRESRPAVLSIAAKSVHVHKTNKVGHTIKETVKLNVLRVFESKAPKGEIPVEWLLLTTEPIETVEQVLRIVEVYKSRWTIEEFFKGLKTGCQLEERLLGDADAWHRLFMLYLPIATNILNLRIRADEEVRLKDVSETQLKILKIKAKEVGKKIQTNHDLKLQIARLGGHIATAGNPGWITLLRGYKELYLLEQGWLLAQSIKM